MGRKVIMARLCLSKKRIKREEKTCVREESPYFPVAAEPSCRVKTCCDTNTCPLPLPETLPLSCFINLKPTLPCTPATHGLQHPQINHK
jgi:hypothetical protein